MDLRKRFGEKQITLRRQNRILVVEHAGRLAGLIVDSASEVLKISADAVEAPPAVFQDGGLNCVTGLGKVAGRLVVLLDMSKLLAPGSLQVKNESAEKKAASKPEARGAAAR
jgi:purine-binding chemotaxis protein CheW